MGIGKAPSAAEALGMIEALAGLVADTDAVEMPAATLAECVQGIERVDAVLAAALGRLLAAFDAKDGASGRRAVHRARLSGQLRAGDQGAGRAVPGVVRAVPGA